MRHFVVSVFIMVTLIINLKIILQERKVRVGELFGWTGIILLMGVFHEILSQFAPILGSFNLYFISPLVLFLYLIKKGHAISKAIIYVSISLFIWITSELFVWVTWSFGQEFDYSDVIFNHLLLLLLAMSLGAMTITLFLQHFYKEKLKKLESSKQSQQVGAILSLFVMLIANLLFALFEPVYTNVEFSILVLASVALFLLIFLGGGGIMGLILYVKNVDNEYQLKKKENEQKSMAYYMETLERQQLEIRRFKHDYQNILLSMDGYFKTKDYDGLEFYYRDKIKKSAPNILKDEMEITDLALIKMPEIKSILTMKLMMAVELGIDVDYEGNEEISAVAMDSVCLIRIIGILLDNAIEAVATLDVKKIRVAFFKSGDDLIFVVENTCARDLPPVQQLKVKGFSTKGDDRGLGLSNLAQLIEKYDHVFLETIVLKDGVGGNAVGLASSESGVASEGGKASEINLELGINLDPKNANNHTNRFIQKMIIAESDILA